MKTILVVVSFLTLLCNGLLISCGNKEVTVGNCKFKQYEGSFSISNVITEFDGRHNIKVAYGSFNPDDTDAPQELKQANLKQSLGYPEGRDFSIGEKTRVKVNFPLSGSCPDKPIVQSPDN